jgi:hypothetical protein
VIPMWLVGVGLGVLGAAAIAAVVWGERAALRRLKRKPETQGVLAVHDSRISGETERKLKAYFDWQQGISHPHCRTVVLEAESTGPPTILCSACGGTLERNGDHFDCTGCGRQVRP